MSEYHRFAIYYVPDLPALAQFGASWLGWDVERGCAVEQPDQEPPGSLISEVTATPRKYGFHGTLKPPFRLAEGTSQSQLDAALTSFAQSQPAFDLAGLHLSRIGRFLALVPVEQSDALAALAAACVQKFDHFRAPASKAELARRRAASLTNAQEANLVAWGYPYVLEEFRFHLTLSGKLEAEVLELCEIALAQVLPDLPAPFPITSFALVGEREDGCFEMIHRYALSG